MRLHLHRSCTGIISLTLAQLIRTISTNNHSRLEVSPAATNPFAGMQVLDYLVHLALQRTGNASIPYLWRRLAWVTMALCALGGRPSSRYLCERY